MVEGSSNDSGHTGMVKYSSSVRQALGNSSSRTNRDVRSRPPHNPPTGYPTWGPGGKFDCGSNAAYVQKKSPPPAGAPMGAVHVCPRCGRYGHTLDICVAPPRFEGNCEVCGQYGHMRRHCSAVTRALRPQQQANVVYGGGAFSDDSSNGDSVSIAAVGGVDGRGDGTTGDATWVQQQDDGMGSDRHRFTLQFALNTSLPLRHLSPLFPPAPSGSSIWVGDSGSSVLGTGSDQFVYNKRLPRPEETYLHIGNGHKLKVEWFGSLDVVLHCKEDVPVTLKDVAVVPSHAFDLMSINCIQERYNVLMNREGAWLLNGRVHFVKSPTGNYIAAARVKHRSADPPAMVAAMMRPGPQRSMNCDDLHFSLGHTNDDNARETAKQRGIKVTGVRGYCDGCGESKAIRRYVPKETTLKAERPDETCFRRPCRTVLDIRGWGTVLHAYGRRLYERGLDAVLGGQEW